MARNILQMALPMTVAQLINILYNIVDRMYLGRLPGHLSLTGLGLCLPSFPSSWALPTCAAWGARPCAPLRGEGAIKRRQRPLWGNAFVMMVAVGILLTVLG